MLMFLAIFACALLLLGSIAALADALFEIEEQRAVERRLRWKERMGGAK